MLDGEWSLAASLLDAEGQPLEGRVVDAVVLPPDRILVFPESQVFTEGYNQPLALYSTQTDAWTWLEPVVAAPFTTGTDSTFVLAANGLVHHFAPGAEETAVYRYDPAANAWDQELVARIAGLYVADAIAQPDGSILIFPVQAPPHSFDPASGQVTPLSTKDSWYRWAEPALGGMVLGFQDAEFRPELGYSESNVACMDPQTGSETPYGPTPPSDMNGASVGNGPEGRTYIFGNPLILGETWAFDHDAGSWIRVPNPTVLRATPLVVAGPDDRLYVIGGTQVPLGPDGAIRVEPTVEVFEPAD